MLLAGSECAVSVIDDLYRVCAKLYAAGPVGISDDVLVPIFHEWIRDRSLDLVLIDVADYTHAPVSPGVMLISHEVSFSLDRSDGRFGLLAQRRRPVDGNAVVAVASVLRDAWTVARKLEVDPRVAGRLMFDTATPRVEANDRLRAPNRQGGCFRGTSRLDHNDRASRNRRP
jgi:hypothetical protein